MNAYFMKSCSELNLVRMCFVVMEEAFSSDVIEPSSHFLRGKTRQGTLDLTLWIALGLGF